MRTLRAVLGVLVLCAGPAFGVGQEEAAGAGSTGERLEKARQEYFSMKAEGERSPDLWYGTPGVRPGVDLLGPLRDLIRKPSGLLDFRPRKIESGLPDRETAEFLRERR
jgi:hypothetical protein